MTQRRCKGEEGPGGPWGPRFKRWAEEEGPQKTRWRGAGRGHKDKRMRGHRSQRQAEGVKSVRGQMSQGRSVSPGFSEKAAGDLSRNSLGGRGA